MPLLYPRDWRMCHLAEPGNEKMEETVPLCEVVQKVGRNDPIYKENQNPEMGGGAPGRDRTRDLRFTKPLLYQLSYKGNVLRLAYLSCQ